MDQGTGEIAKPPITVGYVPFPDGGELYGIVTGDGKSGERSGEVREFRQRQQDEREHGLEVAAERAAERADERAKVSADEAARRARGKVRRLCRRYGLDHMVTLTFPGEGVQDYGRALRLLQDFIHDHGRTLHRGHEWLAVPELHPGGHGWHWHLLVPRRFLRIELAALREGWTDYLKRHGMDPSGGASYARIDVKAFRSAMAASSYAAKYAGKSFDGDDREKGRKRYLIARGMEVEVVRGGASSLAEVEDVARQIGAEHIIDSRDLEEWHGPPMVWAGWDEQRSRGR